MEKGQSRFVYILEYQSFEILIHNKNLEENAYNNNNSTSRQHQSQSENAVFGMPLEVAVALTKIDADDLIPAVFRRCIEYLNDVGMYIYLI